MASEMKKLSSHQVKVAKALRSSGEWLTNPEIASMVSGVAPRTVRACTKTLVELGLVELAEVFPHHRYRWSDKAKQHNPAYLVRLDDAAEAMGI